MNFKNRHHSKGPATKKSAFLALTLVFFLFCNYIFFSLGLTPEPRSGLTKIEAKIIDIFNRSWALAKPHPSSLHHITSGPAIQYRSSYEINYEFTVNETKYEGRYNPYLCTFSSCRVKPEIKSKEHLITVYYDPNDPSKNWPIPMPILSDFEIILISLIISMGLGFLSAIKLSKIKKR